MSRAEVSGVTPAPLPLPLLPLLPLIPSPPVNPESPAEAGGCCWAPPEGVWGDRSPQSLKKVGFLSTLMRETAPRTPEHCPQPLPQFPNLRWPCPLCLPRSSASENECVQLLTWSSSGLYFHYHGQHGLWVVSEGGRVSEGKGV